MIAFDPDFAAPADYAGFYRAMGLQLVPAWMPSEQKSWKRPHIPQWTKYQRVLADPAVWTLWYGPQGAHVARPNMGVITGRVSGNIGVLDLDIHKHPQAAGWWRGLLAVHNSGLEVETVEQRTGGGGLQKLFSFPDGYRIPTFRTDAGVDSRGEGGFAMLAPSLHESGERYEWLPGCAPWEVEIAQAPDWLMTELDGLSRAGTGQSGNGGSNSPFRFAANEGATDGFGHIPDGRETVMYRAVWHGVLEWYRESPIAPPEALWQARCAEAYEGYERRVTSRYPGMSLRDGLERDDRGPTEFWGKWRAAMRKWGTPEFMAAGDRPYPDEGDGFGAEFVEAKPAIDPITGQPLPLLLTAEQFVAGFTPPNYLIDGIVQCGYLYALTARTHHGKTAVTMYMLQCIARCEPMHGREVRGGTVLLLAGENPDDIRARFLVLADAYGFDVKTVKMRFIAGVVNLAARMAEIRAEAEAIDDLMLIVVDTAAAYFPGDETNSNSQQGAYARLLRQLTFLRGKPAVIANCHPVKNAGRENLLPMGGSAFLNEVDGNLTLWANNEKQASLHWLGKFRGPEFDSLSFEMKTATSEAVKDARGRLMPSVVAAPISEATLEAGEAVQEDDENKVLRLMHNNADATFAVLAQKAGFVFEGRPQKARVQRIVERLRDDKMVQKRRGRKYSLTKKGEKEIGVGREDSDE